MKNKSQHAFINGKPVQGEAYIQPAPNYWIGIFKVKKNLLEGDCSRWVSKIVDYEGPINCKGECTDGKGRAKIIHAAPTGKKGNINIHIEAVEQPSLKEEELKKKVYAGYNVNLPRPKVLK